jgi:hypothetical protein
MKRGWLLVGRSGEELIHGSYIGLYGNNRNKILENERG